VIGLHISFFQVFGYDLQNIIGDLGDSRFIMSVVEYNYLWCTGNYEHYWDGFFFFPETEALTYSDNLLGITPVYAVTRLLAGGNPYTAFQLLILACHILNYYSCYWSLNKLTQNRYAAATGAFIFAFSIALNGMHNHPQFTFRFCIPLFFYLLYRYLQTQNFKILSYCATVLIAQFYLGAYLGTFLMVIGGFFALTFLVVNLPGWAAIKKIVLQSLMIVPFALLAMGPQLYFYYKRVKVTGFYASYDYYMETVPRLSSYLKAFPGSPVWSALARTDVHSNFSWLHFLFPGALVILSVITAFYFVIKRDKLFILLLGTIALVVCFSIYYEGHTMYGFLMKVPGVKTVRVVTRIITVLIFPATWIVCLHINKLTSGLSKSKYLVIALLPVVLFIDNYCRASEFKSFSKTLCEERVNFVRNKYLRSTPGKQIKPFAFMPGINKDSHHLHLDAMLAALTLKAKTVNGYSSSCNRYYGPFWTNMDSVSLAGWLNKMQMPMDSIVVIK
jgi:hypothetical protein